MNETFQARQVLENPVFQGALEAMRRRYTEVWRYASTVDEREECWRRMAMLDDFWKELNAALMGQRAGPVTPAGAGLGQTRK
jgi:hypothetical protein